MRRLILFRHARAEPRAANGEDFDRALTVRGRADAALMGKVLARHGLAPQLALVSASRRTAETWDCAGEAFPQARVELRRDLYNAGAEEILHRLEAVGDAAATVMVVGHNPGLHELAVELLIDGAASAGEIERMSAKFPTATAAAFLIDDAGRAAFDGLFFARDNGGEGEG